MVKKDKHIKQEGSTTLLLWKSKQKEVFQGWNSKLGEKWYQLPNELHNASEKLCGKSNRVRLIKLFMFSDSE